jgi:hypothetical protein
MRIGMTGASLRSAGRQGNGVDLYWLPLGAGGSFVRLNGRIYERLVAARERRRPRAIYHSALRIAIDGEDWILEQAPVPDLAGAGRGVVVEGPVGARAAARLRIFRYEVRLWPGGEIPDLGEAVDSPRRLAADGASARAVIDSAPRVPPLTWGRDEMRAGEMWNCNSVVAWILTSAGIDARAIEPPAGGRAPGWAAGAAVAAGGAAPGRPRTDPL